MTNLSPQLACPECSDPIGIGETDTLTCPSCGQTYPMVDGVPSFIAAIPAKAWQEHYDQKAELQKDTAHAVEYNYTHCHRAMQDVMVKLAGGKGTSGLQILDVGCGHGVLASPLVAGNAVTGLDFSLNMLKIARQNGLWPIHGDATALPLVDNQFHIVLCAEVVQHMPEGIEGLFGELVRVCKPGGLVIVSCPNRQSIFRKSNQLAGKLLRRRGGIQNKTHPGVKLRTWPELEAVLVRLPVRLERIGFLYFPLSYHKISQSNSSTQRFLASNYVLCLQKA